MIGFNIMEVLTELKQMPLEDLENHKGEVWEYYKMVKTVLEYKELDNE
mgnify:CR=1 FL=1